MTDKLLEAIKRHVAAQSEPLDFRIASEAVLEKTLDVLGFSLPLLDGTT
jgi:hypothetical protein